jgi:2-oxoglutarate ferredoxin oxidoreductase subunit beta
MPELKDLKGRHAVTWCPGCGDHGIMNALKMAFVTLGLEPHQALMVSGIGCGSKMPQYLKVNGMHTLHGRDMAFASGARLANHDLTVLTVSGDGNTYGIGLSHFLNAARRNIHITQIVQNNQIYGLTKGQYSPTSDPGTISKTSPAPAGSLEIAVEPLALALIAGATFVARGFAKDPRYLADLIVKGIRHRGYALIDILQPCVSFNKVNTYEWYSERVYKVEEQAGYDPADRSKALDLAQEWGARIPIGVLYQVEKPTYEARVPALAAGALVSQPLRHERAALEAIKQEFV